MYIDRLMATFGYQDNRSIPLGSNPLVDFRPSAFTRMLKGTLEYTVFQTVVTYSFAFNGFGIHSYFLQRTGAQVSYGQWARVGLLGQSLAKYGALSLPFFYAKEVVFGVTHVLTREKPKIRKLLSYCYLQNLLAAGMVVPLFNLFEKNWKKSIRGSLVLCAFSLANDLFIEHKRESLFTDQLTIEQIRGRKIAIGVDWLREEMKGLKLKPGMEQQKMLGFDWEGLENLVRINESARYDVESLREEQIELIRKEMQKGFQDFKKFM